MRVKLDENLPHDLARALRRRGHDVHTVLEEDLAGESDPVVVATATDEGRMLLTLDRGIGDLRRYPPGSHDGILVLRPLAQDRDSILALIQDLLDEIDSHPTSIFWGLNLFDRPTNRAAPPEITASSGPRDSLASPLRALSAEALRATNAYGRTEGRPFLGHPERMLRRTAKMRTTG